MFGFLRKRLKSLEDFKNNIVRCHQCLDLIYKDQSQIILTNYGNRYYCGKHNRPFDYVGRDYESQKEIYYKRLYGIEIINKNTGRRETFIEVNVKGEKKT